MTRFWRHDHEKELENALRSSRPEPRSDFVDDVAGRLESTRNRRARRPAGSLRLAFAVVAATALAASAGTVAGLAHNTRGDDRGGGDDASAAIEMNHGQGDNPFDHQYQGKIPVCHKGQTLFLPPPAVLAHLLHGDTLGPCEEPVKIPICHKGHTIQVPIGPDVLAHLRHGDSIGACSGNDDGDDGDGGHNHHHDDGGGGRHNHHDD